MRYLYMHLSVTLVLLISACEQTNQQPTTKPPKPDAYVHVQVATADPTAIDTYAEPDFGGAAHRVAAETYVPATMRNGAGQSMGAGDGFMILMRWDAIERRSGQPRDWLQFEGLEWSSPNRLVGDSSTRTVGHAASHGTTSITFDRFAPLVSSVRLDGGDGPMLVIRARAVEAPRPAKDVVLPSTKE
ncbi:MAG: hypothetical protein ACODAQ_12990 [Phycisphaeraceae bacterium]